MRRPPDQRVRDLPAEHDVGGAERLEARERAERLPVRVVDVDGRPVGQLTDAAVPLEELEPRVVIALDEEVRRDLGLATEAVDVEAQFLLREDEGTVRLREPLGELLRREGFVLGAGGRGAR